MIQKKPLLFFAFIIICLMAVGGGNALRKAMDPEVADTESSFFAGLGRSIKGAVTARLGYTSADANNAKQVQWGRLMYDKHCAACHGGNLEGETKDWRQRKEDGTLPAPPHDASGHTWHHSDQQLFDYTQKGGEVLAPKGFKSGMPGFGEVMKPGDIWAVLAFIKSRWPEDIRRRQDATNKRAN